MAVASRRPGSGVIVPPLSASASARFAQPDRGRIVTTAEREPPHLLVQVGPFDRGAVIAQPLEAGGEAGGGVPAIASIPVQPTDLPLEARKARALAGTLEFPAHELIVREPLGPAAGHRQHVAERLVRRSHLVTTVLALVQRAERALEVADGIGIGIDGARSVAGGEQVAGAAALVGAQAPMMTEGLEVAEPVEIRAGGILEGARDAPVKLARSASSRLW